MGKLSSHLIFTCFIDIVLRVDNYRSDLRVIHIGHDLPQLIVRKVCRVGDRDDLYSFTIGSRQMGSIALRC